MNRKKPVKSFADALLSADSAEVPPTIKPKKPKHKSATSGLPSLSKSVATSKSSSLNKHNSSSGSKHYKSGKQSSSSKSSTTKTVADSTKSLNKPQYRRMSFAGDSSSSGNASPNPFSSSFSKARRHSSSTIDSDDEFQFDDDKVKPSTSSFVEKTVFTANRKAGKAAADKRVAKILAQEEERQQNARILQSVDEDLMLFDLQLEGGHNIF